MISKAGNSTLRFGKTGSSLQRSARNPHLGTDARAESMTDNKGVEMCGAHIAICAHLEGSSCIPVRRCTNIMAHLSTQTLAQPEAIIMDECWGPQNFQFGNSDTMLYTIVKGLIP